MELRAVERLWIKPPSLEWLSYEYGIPIRYPYAGWSESYFDGAVKAYILGPERSFYEELSPKFDGGVRSIFQPPIGKEETWADETLTEPPAGAVPPEDEASPIVFFTVEGKGLLFLGSAGVGGISRALRYAEAQGIDLLGSTRLIQVPGQGSPAYLSPTLLDKLIGPKLTQASESPAHPKIAVITNEDPSISPSPQVVNALIRRGAQVYATEGMPLHYLSGHALLRRELSLSLAEPLTFSPIISSTG